ncbi:jasmonate-induced oxygenase 2-like isoform X3 [Wolffia australiana]
MAVMAVMEGWEMKEEFYQEEEHRPGEFIAEAGGIPLIDLGGGRAAAAEVRAACREWGFFQVVNHGVAAELVEGLHAAAREFFALGAAEKARIRRDAVNPWGYYEAEHTKNVRDWKEVLDFMVPSDLTVPNLDASSEIWTNQWPDFPPQLRDVGRRYGEAVEELAFTLLETIALSLGLPEKRLNGYFEGGSPSSFIRLNHYPACPASDLALGVGRHKDAGALTVLFQDDVGGLDVKRKSDGEWVRVKPIPGSFIVNVGDIIQVWSNDEYESAEHRVTANGERERFSIPFFFNPDMAAMIEPLPELLRDPPADPRYLPYNWGSFFQTRRSSNFAKLPVDNIQIHHFKPPTPQT